MPRKKRRSKRDDSSFRKRNGVRKKLVKIRKGKKQVKHDDRKPEVTRYCDRGTIPITPQMIRWAVKELHKRRVFVTFSMISDHLKRCYPIQNNPKALKQELEDKIDDAVSFGLIVKCGNDSYGLPTLRQQANSEKSDFSAFSERYNKPGSRIRRKNLVNTRKKMKKSSQHNWTCCDDDEESDIP